MRQQFTYRLDEEKIRKELRGHNAPYSADAYQRFCAYSDAHSRPVSGRSISKIKLKIERRYALPAAAAVVLLALSLLFANFAGAGKADRRSADLTAEPFVPAPVFEPETIIPQPMTHDLPDPVSVKNDEGMQASRPGIVKQRKTSDTLPQDENDKPLPLAASPPDDTSGRTEAQTATTQAQTATTQADVKKKQRRDAALILEPVQLPDIRPTLPSTEQEEDIRTN